VNEAIGTNIGVAIILRVITLVFLVTHTIQPRQRISMHHKTLLTCDCRIDIGIKQSLGSD